MASRLAYLRIVLSIGPFVARGSLLLQQPVRTRLGHVQAGDQLKVADVRRPHFVAKLQSARPNPEVRERNADTFGLALAADLSGAESDRNGHRLDGYTREQLVKESLPFSRGVRLCWRG